MISMLVCRTPLCKTNRNSPFYRVNVGGNNWLIAAILVLIALDEFLLLQNHKLRHAILQWKKLAIQEANLFYSEVPHFSCTDLQENLIDSGKLGSEFTLLLFFSLRGCPPCLEELTLYEDLQKEIPSNKLRIIGIAYHPDRRELEKYIQGKGLTFPIVWDKEGKIRELFKIKRMRFKVLVSPDKRILAVAPLQLRRDERLSFAQFVKETASH